MAKGRTKTLSNALSVKGMSQTKMAKIFDVDPSYINHILHGRYGHLDPTVLYDSRGEIQELNFSTKRQLLRCIRI